MKNQKRKRGRACNIRGSSIKRGGPPTPPSPQTNGMPPFRLKAKHIFLTYPRSSFDPTALYNFLKSIAPIHHCIVATEQHEDGEPHVHAAVSYERTIDTRSQARFDYENRHPNIQKARSWHAVCAYIKKDGDYHLFNGEGEVADSDAVDWSSGDFTEDPYARAERCSNRREWIRHCIEARIPPAYGFAIWNDLQSTLPLIIQSGEEDIRWAGRLGDLRLRAMHWPADTNRSVVIIGATGSGKTSWAKLRAPRPALFVRHIDDLKHMNSTIKSIIFDDMDFGHTPRQNQIFLVDMFDTATIHCRHVVARIPAGVCRVFTGNHFMFMDDPAIERRIQRIDL